MPIVMPMRRIDFGILNKRNKPKKTYSKPVVIEPLLPEPVNH